MPDAPADGGPAGGNPPTGDAPRGDPTRGGDEPGAAPDAGDRHQPGLRDVLLIAAAALAVVLGLEALSAAVPAVREAFRGLPITIGVLVMGTLLVLLAIARRRPPA